MKRLRRAVFPPEFRGQLKALSHYRVFYDGILLSVFARMFFRVWEIFDGKLDAISFDYWLRYELRNEGFL